MYQTFERKIGDNEYCIVAFTGSNGLILLAELVGYIAPFCKLLSSDLSSGFSLEKLMNMSITEDAIDKVIDSIQEMLLEKDKRERIIAFIKRLVSTTSRNGKDDLSNQLAFDLAFSANYGELFSLLKEVISVNFFSQSFTKDLFAKQIQQEVTKKKESTVKNG